MYYVETKRHAIPTVAREDLIYKCYQAAKNRGFHGLLRLQNGGWCASSSTADYGRPFVSKLWHDIPAVLSHVYLQSFLLHDIRAFFATYTCVLSCFVGFLFPSIWPFSYKRAYICAQKSPYICVTNKHVVYGVTESRRIRGTELYRQQKTPSCTMELKSNFSLNQAWPQCPR